MYFEAGTLNLTQEETAQDNKQEGHGEPPPSALLCRFCPGSRFLANSLHSKVASLTGAQDRVSWAQEGLGVKWRYSVLLLFMGLFFLRQVITLQPRLS